MPTTDDNKPLGAWPDDDKHKATDPAQEDENSIEELEDTAKDDSDDDTLDNAQKVGLYPNATEEKPVELGEEDITGDETPK